MKTPSLNVRCYDNGGETLDRYTVVYLDYPQGRFFESVGMSADPFHPQGFGQHGECKDGLHLGNRIEFADLPEKCQQLVRADLSVS